MSQLLNTYGGVQSISIGLNPNALDTNKDVFFIMHNSGTISKERMEHDLNILTNDEIVSLFIEDGLYRHITGKDSEELYAAFLEKLDPVSIKLIFKKQAFITAMSQSIHGKQFLFRLFNSCKIPRTRFSLFYQKTLVDINVDEYISALNDDIELLSKLIIISGSLSYLKTLIEYKENVSLEDICSTEKIISYLIGIKIDINLLNFISTKDDFCEYLEKGLNNTSEDNVKKLFKNRKFLEVVSESIKGKELLTRHFSHVKNTTGILPNLEGIFSVKK